MIDAPSRAKACKESTAFIQFSLWQLFIGMTILAVYFALVRATGGFVATLAAGLIIMYAVVTLLRIENLVLGGIAGTVVATLLLLAAGLAEDCPPDWRFVVACFAYPIVGYACGLTCATIRQMQFS